MQRTSRLIPLALALLLCAGAASAQVDILMRVDSHSSGWLQGDVMMAGYEGWIELQTVDHAIEVAFDPATGRPSSLPVHHPVQTATAVDRATLPLMDAMLFQHQMDVQIHFLRMVDSRVQAFLIIELDNAFLTTHALSDSAPEVPAYQTDFVYQRIRWIWPDTGIIVESDWAGSAVAQAPSPSSGRTYLQAMSPNPTPGETRVQLDSTEKLYRLDLDQMRIPDLLSRGRLRARRLEAADVALATEWRAAFSVESLGEADNESLRLRSRASVENALEHGRTWLLEDESGRPVSTTSFNATTAKAVQVGGVWTPPEFRSRGYGRAVVAASLLHARKEGVEQAILFTDEANIPAQRAYEALGFEQIGDYRLLFLRKPLRADEILYPTGQVFRAIEPGLTRPATRARMLAFSRNRCRPQSARIGGRRRPQTRDRQRSR